jgi:hypothetical protein
MKFARLSGLDKLNSSYNVSKRGNKNGDNPYSAKRSDR